MHTVVATVTTSLSKQQASSSVQVIVGQGSLVAVIAGGKSQSMRVGESLMLDAGSSYDEDVGKSATNSMIAVWQYSWSCTQLRPVLSSTCSNAVHNATQDIAWPSKYMLVTNSGQ